MTLTWHWQVAKELEEAGQYHVAKKQIPSLGGKVDGIKLELFIFDSFRLADKVVLMEVERASQFAPVKNAPGAQVDSPDTACALCLSLHKSWIQAAGGRVEGAAVELSPLASFAGEELEGLCKGVTFSSPLSIELPKQDVPLNVSLVNIPPLTPAHKRDQTIASDDQNSREVKVPRVQ